MSTTRIQLDNADKLFRTEKYMQATELYSAVIATGMELPTAYSNRGRCYYRMGQINEALADLSRAIDLSPRTTSYRFTRGRYHLEAGLFEDACADFSNVLELERGSEQRPFFEAAVLFRAEANLNLHRFADSLRDCTEIKGDFSLYILGRLRTRDEIMQDARAGLGKSGSQQ